MSKRQRKQRQQQRDMKRGAAMHEFQIKARKAMLDADRRREAGDDDGFGQGIAGLDGDVTDDPR